jgi:hypothetical protein
MGFNPVSLPKGDSSTKMASVSTLVNHPYKPNKMPDLPSKIFKAHGKVKKRFLVDLAVKLRGLQKSSALHGKSGIVGIGIGEKVRNGRYTGEPSITFHVLRKVHSDEVAPEDRIPKEIDGIPTDVIAVGEGYPLASALPKQMQPGESLRNVRGTAGTLGCLVARGRDLCLLSNNHVIALSNAGTKRNASAGIDGDLIFYDVILTDGTTQEFPIGYLLDFPSIWFNQNENGLDCAIAVTDPAAVDPVNFGLGKIDPNPVSPFVGQSVQKFGRHGLSTGVVRFVEQTIDLNYGAQGVARFVGQMLIQSSDGGSFAGPGDSGSLVVDHSGNHPVGLLFGGFSGFSVATPIDAVLARLNASLVT